MGFLYRHRGVLVIVLALGIGPPLPSVAGPGDPYESVNRRVFAFNEFMDRWVLKPVAEGYRWVTPGFVDRGVTNFFSNLGEIRNLLNSALQGDFRQAGSSTGRFLTNSTVGIGGLVDVASEVGLEYRREDFGQTLAVWGADGGPYIVLPFLGGSSIRDAFGRVPDVYLSPLTYMDDVAWRNSLRALDLVDTRADLIDSEALLSGDRYTFLKDIYEQRRQAAISNGVPSESSYEFDEDF